MKKVFRSIMVLKRNQKKYFQEFEEEISVRNLQLMRTICYAGIAMFCIYFVITKLFFAPWSSSAVYLFPVPVLGIFLLVIKKVNTETPNVKTSNTLVRLMYIFLVAVTIILSVFPMPDIPSVYYHLFILACPVLFILPIYMHLFVVFSSYAVFCLLVLAFKAPAIWPHELFESFTAVIFSCVVMILMTQFRLQSDSLKSKYYQMSQLDGLTYLMNKVSGIHAGEQYLTELKPKEHFAVLFIDLDNFKKINDTFGHMTGDEILQSVSRTLRASCRKSDILCRFGGDEFLIVLKNILNEDVTLARVEFIRKSINAIRIDSVREVGCSIGVFYVEDLKHMTMDMLLEKADESLYQAKQKGKNCYYVTREF